MLQCEFIVRSLPAVRDRVAAPTGHRDQRLVITIAKCADVTTRRRQLLISSTITREPMDAPPDIEDECENAVFELCDARERYPARCAEELGKHLELKTNMAMEPVILKPSSQTFEIPRTTEARDERTLEETENPRQTWVEGAERMQRMINKIQKLKVALKQLEDNKKYETKHELG